MMSNYRLTDHVREEAERRGIPLDVLDAVLLAPDLVVGAYGGRLVYQSKIEFEGKLYLVRAIVEESDLLTALLCIAPAKLRSTGEKTNESKLRCRS